MTAWLVESDSLMKNFIPGQIISRHHLTVGIPALIVAVGCFLLYGSLRSIEQEKIQIEFEAECAQVASELEDNLEVYHEVVQSVASFFDGSLEVTREGFQNFVRRDIQQNSGILALEWIPLVKASDRTAYEQQAKSDGLPDFQFKRWNQSTEWVADSSNWADTYFPVYYMEPMEQNSGIAGIDLGSNPIRKQALKFAAESGQPVATADIPLARQAAHEKGVLLFVPVYDRPSAKTESTLTRESRRDLLRGFALGVFRISDIMQAVFDRHPDFPFELVVTEASEKVLFRTRRSNRISQDTESRFAGLTYGSTYSIGGRAWTFQFECHPDWLEAQEKALAFPIACGGILFAALICSLLHMTLARASTVEHLVRERTAALEQANKVIGKQRDDLQRGRRVLQESNQQLKEFAYAASHDLQTPLRGVASYAQFLKEDYGSVLDEDGRLFIERIIDSAHRMQQLTVDLLEYSRVEFQKESVQLTDLNLVVTEVLILLQNEMESVNAEVTCDRLPVIYCDEKQVGQLFRNLIANALKYRSDRPPRIQITSTGTDVHQICIQDNGIGIAAEFQNRVFDIFRRLHTHSEYPGTGIGLALCRRIVQRHGGKIWVESTQGEGSRFLFTFPIATCVREQNQSPRSDEGSLESAQRTARNDAGCTQPNICESH